MALNKRTKLWYCRSHRYGNINSFSLRLKKWIIRWSNQKSRKNYGRSRWRLGNWNSQRRNNFAHFYPMQWIQWIHQRITDLINLMFPYWIIINRINNKRELDFIFNLTTAFVFFLSLSLSPSSTYQE